MQTRDSHPTRELPEGNRQSIQQTEWNYSLMLHFSQALGVNCTYCHNSRAFSSWEESPPQRVTAWHGIRMVRDINNTYIEPLRPSFPPHRLGVLGDTLKANCTTCHQGAWAPLYGAPMLRDYPELGPPPEARRADAAPR
jgi:photosynthetic reaction center cytochrome c subunit